MKISIGCDEAAYELKEAIKKRLRRRVIPVWTMEWKPEKPHCIRMLR